MAKALKRVADFQPSSLGLKELIGIDELVGKEVILTDFVETEGDFGLYVVVAYKEKEDGELKGFTTGGSVVIKKLRAVKKSDGFPVLAKVLHDKKYYDIV